jgi:hypothetical protein
MEKILYIVQTTSKFNPKWKELKTSHIDDFVNQFPGSYFSLVTKDNIEYENFYGGKFILIFSKKLLEQKNYHINMKDHNGYISEHNSYFPWNLEDAVEKIAENGKSIGNEVVFHDPIPMKYLCVVINRFTLSISINDILPRIPIFNEYEPDLTKEPFVCYPLEDNYTGEQEGRMKSSRDFFVKMAETCEVDSSLSSEEIVAEIKKKIPDLYENRNKQRIEFLQNDRKTRTKRTKTKECVSTLLYELGQPEYKETLIYTTDLRATNSCPIRVFEAVYREGSTKKRTKKRSDSGSDESQDEESSDEVLTKSFKRMRLGGKKKRGTKKQR